MFSFWNAYRNTILKIAVAALCILVLPYAYSRLASRVRRINVQTINVVHFPTKVDGRSTLRVATYNIAHGRGCTDINFNGESSAQRYQRLDGIASLLKQIDADIVVLNEVDFDASWSGHVDQANYLAKQAKYPYVAKERNLDFRILGWTWCFGNAVLSKYPIEQAQEVDLPSYAAWETALAGKKRGLNCVVRLRTGQSVRVLATHLSPRSEALRVKSVQQLIAIARQSKFPTLLAGDLNSAPAKNSFGIPNAIKEVDASKMFNRHRLSETAPEFTFPADTPQQAIDWIFVPANARLVDYCVVDSKLSDHRPVVADMEISVK